MESLFSSFILIMIFLILAFFIVSWLLSKNLWQPFYNTLSRLNEYDIKQHDTYHFDESSINEFNQLSTSLNKMTDKIYSDFLQQKEFTENASHEMQTPLAVVKANLSLLVQSPNLKEEEMNQLQAIENTVKKLTALNKALILLSKIDNHQFNENVAVNFNDKITSIIKHYEEVWQSKNITIETVFDNALIVSFNTTLADVLITNLLQNAIRHNYENGTIKISINKNLLTITNTGEALSIPENELFVRFKKNDASKDSLGLGLSIVKSITMLYNINVSYNYKLNKHVFTLNF
jgi:signal transduction histidine kinase